MKKSVVFLYLVTLLTAFIVQSAKADLIAGWDFATLSSGGPAVPATISATVGTATLDLSAFSVTPIERTNFAGSTLNAFAGGDSTAGQALTIQGSSANGKSMIFSFSMSGYDSLIVSFATRGTGTGYDTGTWAWSTDGLSYTPLVGVNTATRSTTFAVTTADFTTAIGLDNASTAYLQYTLSGASSASGNNRLDNIQLNATALPVPEPSAIALAALGGVACLVAVRRRR